MTTYLRNLKKMVRQTNDIRNNSYTNKYKSLPIYNCNYRRRLLTNI